MINRNHPTLVTCSLDRSDRIEGRISKGPWSRTFRVQRTIHGCIASPTERTKRPLTPDQCEALFRWLLTKRPHFLLPNFYNPAEPTMPMDWEQWPGMKVEQPKEAKHAGRRKRPHIYPLKEQR